MSSTIQARSAARLAAVQALYQAERRGADAASIVEEFRRFRLSEADTAEGQPDLTSADAKHFARVVLGEEIRRAEGEALIDAVLPARWPRMRLDPVLRAVLRAAAFELLAREDVPARAVINEYVAVATAFFTGGEIAMVNGALDAMARGVRAAEFADDESNTAG
jgi:N utilization substance protein B